MPKSILLPIDLNHEASWQKALPMALDLAGDGGTLHVLGIVHDLGAAAVANFLPEGFEEKALAEMKTGLDEFISENVPAGRTAVSHVGHGHVAEKTLEAAKAIDADVIVMASHPPDELMTWLVGSQADRVVRHADRPVLVVR
jgi:nucleotide-binding universal stress UspA family protein